ncbi:MAG TPA: ABC transporter substrate-binding protein, partial [Thermomicrobiales bacterium]|nr:ABC transporter substrate-binding protein [Thermomicrobiales bacterium]
MAGDDQQLRDLEAVWRASRPTSTRRQVLKWSTVAAGAVATARFGVASAASTPTAGHIARFQDAEILTDQTISVPLDPYGQVITLDPQRSVNWGPLWALFPNVWGGLVRYDENAKVQLDLAESFTVSEDGREYQFKIRSDAKYASGNQVKAGDFVASWMRALDPENPSPMVSFMTPIRNYTKFMQQNS